MSLLESFVIIGVNCKLVLFCLLMFDCAKQHVCSDRYNNHPAKVQEDTIINKTDKVKFALGTKLTFLC